MALIDCLALQRKSHTSAATLGGQTQSCAFEPRITRSPPAGPRGHCGPVASLTQRTQHPAGRLSSTPATLGTLP